MKMWLLRNKQTNRWQGQTATADACYALLMQGQNWLNNQVMPEIQWGGNPVNWDNPPVAPETAVIEVFSVGLAHGVIDVLGIHENSDACHSKGPRQRVCLHGTR